MTDKRYASVLCAAPVDRDAYGVFVGGIDPEGPWQRELRPDERTVMLDALNEYRGWRLKSDAR